MWEDHSLVQPEEPHEGQEAVSDPEAAVGAREALFHEGDGGFRIPDQDAALFPARQLVGGTSVLVVALTIAGHGHAQVHSDDVVPAAVVEAGPEFRTDDIVRRRHHLGQLAG